MELTPQEGAVIELFRLEGETTFDDIWGRLEKDSSRPLREWDVVDVLNSLRRRGYLIADIPYENRLWLVAEPEADAAGEIGVFGEHHPALAGGDVLPAVEGPDDEIAGGLRTGPRAADRLAGVLNQRHVTPTSPI